jgi:hypothetical protein
MIDEDTLALIEDTLDHFHHYWGSSDQILSATAALALPLLPSHTLIQCAQWPLFLNYRIKAFQGCQETVPALQSMQCSWCYSWSAVVFDVNGGGVILNVTVGWP